MKNIKNKIGAGIEVLGLLFLVYLAGLMFVLICYGLGSDGSDLLSQHYRGTVLFIINLI